jgi:hypothetical protein
LIKLYRIGIVVRKEASGFLDIWIVRVAALFPSNTFVPVFIRSLLLELLIPYAAIQEKKKQDRVSF